ncbi:MAG: hypothetical protein Q9O62_01615 [Ardenticatenia bacterium]|nr:hypothetical protein [Ardenticatenia bacterium]
MEIVGECLGLDTDKAISHCFRRYWADWFPALRDVHRTTFGRQAANLTWVKAALWQDLLRAIPYAPYLSIVDRFPAPVCRLVRAYRSKAPATTQPPGPVGWSRFAAASKPRLPSSWSASMRSGWGPRPVASLLSLVAKHPGPHLRRLVLLRHRSGCTAPVR